MRRVIYIGFVATFLLSSLLFSEDEGDDEPRIPSFTTKSLTEWKVAGPIDDIEYSKQKRELLKTQRDEIVGTIEDLLTKAPSSDREIELSLRLARLYLEDYYFGISIAGEQGSSKGLDKAEKAWERAKALLENLVRKYPKSERRDEILYAVATAYMDKQKTKESVAALKELVSKFPTSPFFNDALVLLADQLFDLADFKGSEKYFLEIISRKYSQLITYANYKLAWCAYNLQNYEVSYERFEWVIKNEDLLTNQHHFKMRNEALIDIALPLAELRSVDRVIEYYKKLDPATNRKGLEVIAFRWKEKGFYKDAISLWTLLLGYEANHPHNPQYDVNIASSTDLQSKNSESYDYLVQRFPFYGVGSAWFVANKEEDRKTANDTFEEAIRKGAMESDAIGHKTKNQAKIQEGKDRYNQYLKIFGEHPEALPVRKYLAAILYNEGNYWGAAEQFDAIYDRSKDEKVKLSAINDSIGCYGTLVTNERKEKNEKGLNETGNLAVPSRKEEASAFIPYSSAEKKFIERSDTLLKDFPEHKDLASVLYRVSYLRYSHKEIEKGSAGFATLIKNHPKSPEATSAAYIQLDIFNQRDETDTLIDTCRIYLSLPLNGKTLKADVGNILRRAELKRITKLEAEGKYEAAADRYIEYGKSYGKDDKVLYEGALNNASIDYRKANNAAKAVKVEEEFLTLFPLSKNREQITLQVGNTYELMGNFQKAAKYLSEFGRLFPWNAQAKNALELAAIYYGGSGNFTESERCLKEVAARHPNESSKVEKLLLESYQERKAADLEFKYLVEKARRKTPPSEEFLLGYQLSALDPRNKGMVSQKEKAKHFEKGSFYFKQVKENPKALELYAQLLFESIQVKQKEFNGIKFELPQKKLERNLGRKLELIQALEKEYLEVAKLGSDEWGLASLYNVAANYHIFAEQVEKAPVPPELTEGAIDAYKEGVKNSITDPFNSKALQLSERCLKEADALRIYSPWIVRCYSLSSELSPKLYPPIRTFYVPAQVLAILSPDEKGEPPKRIEAVNTFIESVSPMRTLAQNTELSESLVPTPISHEVLRKEFQSNALAIKEDYDANGKDLRELFWHLNALRLTEAKQALSLTLKVLEENPGHPAFYNLLGMVYLEMGNFSAAKATWLSMIARGDSGPVPRNNLGVLQLKLGKEKNAISYFFEASEKDCNEARKNLSILSLKYRNGREAKRNLNSLSRKSKDDRLVEISIVMANLQNGEEIKKSNEFLADDPTFLPYFQANGLSLDK